MDPWQFMLVAERLIAKCRDSNPHPQGAGAQAAELRTAISRCYYSTFLTCRSLLLELGFQVTATGACHSVVQRALIASSERSLSRVASEYATLGEYRRKADYDLNDTDVEKLEFAEDFDSASRRTPRSSRCSHGSVAIKPFERNSLLP